MLFQIISFALALLGPIPQQAIDAAMQATVYIEATIADNRWITRNGKTEWSSNYSEKNQPICSGFVGYQNKLNGDLYIVTAEHCAHISHNDLTIGTSTIHQDLSKTPTEVYFKSGEALSVKSIYRFEAFDTAILTVHPDTLHSIVNFHDDFQIGEALFVYGMPGGSPWVMSLAYSQQGPLFISNLSGQIPFQYQATYGIDCSSCTGGDSGAGVFNGNGEVIGMADAISSITKQVLVIPISHIREVLNTFLQTKVK